MILDDILGYRREQLDREMNIISMEEMVTKLRYVKRKCLDFKSAIAGFESLAVIAEVKKSSPSKNVIREDFNPVQIAKEYEKCGANAISCLTEVHYFNGSSEIFRAVRKAVKIPLLRKDFIFHEYQIYESRVIGADCILLIMSMLSSEDYLRLLNLAEKLGLYVLTEVHNETELSNALAFGADIIGINNRNLKTFNVSLKNTQKLSKLIPEGKNITLISESGIATNDDMRFIRSCGIDAVLIGETLMRSNSIKETMAEIRRFTF